MASINPKTRKRFFDRLSLLYFFFFVFGGILIFRLFDLQVLKATFYKGVAEDMRGLSRQLAPRRGEIFISGQHPLAINIESSLLYAVPARIEDPELTASKLAPFLDVEPESEEFKKLVEKLSKKHDVYEPLRHGHELTDFQLNEIKGLGLEGIAFEPETYRYYPEEELFSHVLGFVGYKEDIRQGQYGVEEYFEEELAGQPGLVEAEHDPAGRIITTSQRVLEKPEDGDTIVLTLDRAVQFKAYQVLEATIKEFEAERGTAIVLEPQTGRILAMVSLPDFDPNKYSEVEDMGNFLNPAISRVYEPGSIFKVITFAAALDSGLISPTTKYEDKGFVKIGAYTIRNSDDKAHGIQTMTEVLEKSLNTGAIFVVRLVGRPVFEAYVRDFGFGSLTDVELPGEARGDVSSLKKKEEVYSATASYGQGITVTPLQLVTAFAAIANGGKLVKPYLVDEIIKPDGQVTKNRPRVIREVISAKTARTLSAMLVSVVKNGFGRRAGVPGYYVAGKTGTAEVAREGEYSDETIHSFVGFAPIDSPRFVILVKLDNPKLGRFASYTAASAFGQIAEFLLDYYGIAPNESF